MLPKIAINGLKPHVGGTAFVLRGLVQPAPEICEDGLQHREDVGLG